MVRGVDDGFLDASASDVRPRAAPAWSFPDDDDDDAAAAGWWLRERERERERERSLSSSLWDTFARRASSRLECDDPASHLVLARERERRELPPTTTTSAPCRLVPRAGGDRGAVADVLGGARDFRGDAPRGRTEEVRTRHVPVPLRLWAARRPPRGRDGRRRVCVHEYIYIRAQSRACDYKRRKSLRARSVSLYARTRRLHGLGRDGAVLAAPGLRCAASDGLGRFRFLTTTHQRPRGAGYFSPFGARERERERSFSR